MTSPAKIFHSLPALAAGKKPARENKTGADAGVPETRIAPPKKPSLASMIIKMLPDPDPNQELTTDVGLRPAKVFTFVEDMPEFPGGTRALLSYLHDHLHYPDAARQDGVQGTVVVQFIVHPDGRLSDITTVGPAKGDGLETEALRVVRDMPDWIPGTQQGVPVAVRYALPVRFLLTESPGGEQPSTVRSTTSSASAADHVFTFVEQMPAFPGGKAALRRYLRNHIRYPDKAREQGIQGTVITHFIVNPDGSLSGIETTGPEKGGGLEEEAIRVISQMPSWHPAIQNGRKVSVAYSLPIRFVLQ
jgi:TonB family protein